MKCIALLVQAAEVLYFSHVTHASKTPGQACYERVRMLTGDENMNRWQTFVVQISGSICRPDLTSANCEGVAAIPHSAVLSLYANLEKKVPSTSEMAVEYHVENLCPKMQQNKSLSDIKHGTLLTVSPYIWFW